METPFEHTNIPIAIIGMACRLPGADDLDQYWQLISGGGSAVAELPHERLDQELYYHPKKGQRNKSYAKLGAIISSRQFNRQACPIPPQLERGVDNAHLLMCETAAAACRHARLDPFQLPLRNTGVWIGHAQGSNLAADLIYGTCVDEAAQFLKQVSGFQQLPAVEQEAIIRELVSSVQASVPKLAADSPDVTINMVAGTISKAFRLSGPFMGVNSACASSLQSVLLAARSLQLGRVDMAIVGGASDCKTDSLVLFSYAQSMSDNGSRPFDADADGLICGEGYVALVLKTLPRALADGDPIQAVVLGMGMSCDGRGKSLWAPRKEGQVKAMERAYRHGLDMATLQYLEAHATSTNLGDATELNALGEILSSKFPPGKKIPITSVKANIGHALEAAGVSSLIKTILCIQHQTFAPAINIRSLNPKIDWANAPFYIPQQPAPWPAQTNGLPRRAAVNAFGIGGLNMHLVVEEFTEDRRAALASQYAAAKPGRSASMAPSDPDAEAVAIVGMGCVFPGASDTTKFWELLSSGRDPKGPTPAGRWGTGAGAPAAFLEADGTPAALGGYITDFSYDWRAHKLPPKQVQQADPLQFMLLEAADAAIKDAGYDKKEFDRTRVGVLVGTEFGGDFSSQLELGLRLPHMESILKQSFARRGLTPEASAQIASQFGEVLLKHWPALVDESGSFSTSTLASRITKTMNLMGGAAAIDSSDTSAAAVLATSVDFLVSGDCDMMICAAGQRRMNLPQYETMALSGTLASGNPPRSPFDAAANGIVPGEGVGVLVLKRLVDARRDGDKIHAVIRGLGVGHAETTAEAMQLAMNRAFQIAGVAPGDVALIEMDGVGLPEKDQEQLGAVLAAYGTTQRSEPLVVSTITGHIGHTAGVSAMASLMKASFEVETGQMPATFGLQQPLDIVAKNAATIQTATQPLTLRHTTRDGRRFAAVSSSSKGQAYHILLERGQKVVASAPPQAPAAVQAKPAPVTVSAPAPVAASPIGSAGEPRIYRLGAATPAELTARIEQALGDSGAAFAAAATSRFRPEDHSRLAIVAGNAESLAKKLQLASKQFTNPDARLVLEQQGCVYRQLPVRRPRVAFVFPGQGSQYAGMLRELVRDVPAAAAAMREIDTVMTLRGYQTFGQMAWENPAQLGTDIWVTQVVMLLSDLIMHAAVTDLGIHADLVTGHSYGEFAALTAAEVWDREGVVTAARARYEAIQATPTARGTLMATTAPPAIIEELAATLADRPYIANYNAPDQTVVGGRPEALQKLNELLTARGFKSQLITVPCPFHTPLMEGVGAILARTLESLRLRAPRVPVLSSVTNRYVAEPDDIRANLAAQLTTPVRWVELINRIADEQETVFVEVGPQQALTKLNRRILEGRNIAGIIACDNPKNPGLEQLLQVRALLECCGAIGELQAAQVVAAAGTPPAAPSKPAKGTIEHFDATQRRIEKMRQRASEGAKGAGRIAAPAAAPPNGDKPTPQPAARNGDGPGHAVAAPRPAVRQPSAAAPAQRIAPPVAATAPAPAAPAPAPVAAAAAPARQAAPASAPNPAELEKFLINFVVEQTGYPPEVVELDADLEADLGIDSIKKAQLFGELAEYFDVQSVENLTLDDFPTLRHVTNFLATARVKGDLLSNGAAAASAPVAPVPIPRPAPAPAPAPAPVPVAAAPAPAAQVPAAGAPNPAELEKFLINFVVEQTGYPPEVVELDADLEADLGIDSIKKAQLFGELAEYFDVQSVENLTLDDFPTLRHVTNFLATARVKGDLLSNGAAVAAQAPVASAPVAPPPPAPVAAPAPAPAPVAAAPIAPAAPQPAAAGAPDPAELEKFLINFVVEQTGYPPEVVELDADLEADLGIDSIKKAQLFGELAEYFDVQSVENLTLDDFPTLRHVTNFLATARVKGDLLANGAPAAAPAPAVAPVTAPVAFTPAPAPAPAPVAFTPAPAPAPAPAIAEAANGAATAVAAYPPVTRKPGAPEPADLEKFLINFVVEQTGYPPEVVELDADLEADLGIDSIKKAQLFGELAEYFDVQSVENLTLDDFPTLRHVVDFLQGNALKKNLIPNPSEAPEAAPEPAFSPAPAANGHAEGAQPLATTAVAETEALAFSGVLQSAGTAHEMGVAHGRQKQREIRRILRRYADLDGPDADELPLAAGAEPSSHFTAAELDELAGIAEAVGVPLASIVAHNLAIYSDFGTSSLHQASQRTGSAALVHTSSVQLPLVGALADCLLPVVQIRSSGIPHAIVSIVGTTGALCGVNASGLGVSVSAASGARGGRAHAVVAEHVLAQAESLDAAFDLLRRYPAQGTWNACLTDRATGRIGYVESNGRAIDVREVSSTLNAGDAQVAAGGDVPRIVTAIDHADGTLEVNLFTGSDLPATVGRYSLDELLPPWTRSQTIAPVAPEPIAPVAPYDLPAEDNDETHRFFMRELAVPLGNSVPPMPQWKGAALIVGDNPLADALRTQIEASGGVARQLPISDDLDATLAAFEQIWNEQPTPHVFIVTPRDLEAGDRSDPATWQRRWYRVALLPYFLCQRWTQLAAAANLLDGSTIVAATGLGGNFGFSGAVDAPECGALTGLMKTIHIEVAFLRNNRQMRAKVVDAPNNEPPQSLAANICRELASGEVDYEVAYVAGKRYVQCAYPETAPVRQHAEIRPGGTWVVTGGSRGITAECALELGRRFGLKLHLIGSSPRPDVDDRLRNLSADELKAHKLTVMREARAAGKSMDDEWSRVQKAIEIDRSLRTFAAEGVDVTYHSCDVSDGAALAAVLEAVRRESGPIEGILHGAGIERPGSYERKSRELVMATLGAKVDGAVHLMRLTRNDPVRWFIGFGSVSGRLGSNGQTDYGLASDALCKLAAWYKTLRPEVHSVGFHWHPWGEVGMAARPESAALLRVGNAPAHMPKREGINHFLRELYAGAPTPEILITSFEYHGRYYGPANRPQPVGDTAPEAASEPWAPLSFVPVASRRELILVDAPLPSGAGAKVQWQGPACILGVNADALALRDRLVSEGATVHMLPVSTNAQELTAAIEAIYASQPPRYLFVMSGRDRLSRSLLERDAWQQRRAVGVMGPFQGLQQWFRLRAKAKDTTPITIVAATSLGGDYGISQQVSSPEGGALAGLLKSLYVEDSRLAASELRVKVIDAPANEQPNILADAICRELAADDPNVEVAWSGGRRSVLRSIVRPVETLAKRPVPRGGNWVVTGGARGITAAAALELGKRFGLKLHLVGKSPAPRADAPWRNCTAEQLAEIKAGVVRQEVAAGRSPDKAWDAIKFDIEIHDTLAKFAAAGVTATYHSCDLADWDQLAAVLAEIRKQDGPIEGIIHGAGYGRSGRFGTRNLQLVERTLAGKLDGAIALMSLTRQDPLRYFLGFGSIGGRYGGNGLSDYAMANDMFAKLCQWFRVQRPECAVGCMDWQSWDQIGMAMLGDNAMGSKGRLKMVFISPTEGIEHLCRELEAGLPTSEVVITDGHFERTFYPFVDPSAAAAPVAEAEPSSGGAPLDRLPLVQSFAGQGGGSVAEVHFEPTADPFLVDHQFRGKPLLPAVIALESIAETARLQSGKHVTAIRDVQLVEGLFFHTDRTLVARVRAAAEIGGTIACDLVSDLHNRAGKLLKKDRVHVRAVAEVADEAARLDIPMAPMPDEWHAYEFKTDGPLYHGPVLRGVKAVMYDAANGWGQLAALSLAKLGGARPGRDWIVPATLLDAGFYVCGIHAWLNAGQAFSLPASIERVRLGRLPREDESCLLACQCREMDPKQAIYDFTVFGDDQHAILQVQGHRLVMVRS